MARYVGTAQRGAFCGEIGLISLLFCDPSSRGPLRLTLPLLATGTEAVISQSSASDTLPRELEETLRAHVVSAGVAGSHLNDLGASYRQSPPQLNASQSEDFSALFTKACFFRDLRPRPAGGIPALVQT